jgi:segregation and condensation protein B
VRSLLESLLFVAQEPVPLRLLASALDLEVKAVQEALEGLTEEYAKRGLRVQHLGDVVQMVTAPEAAYYVERFLGMDHQQRLSTAALETLAIIAYRQPTTRAAIDAIRGVGSDRAVATLIVRGLVEEVGRADSVGRPALLGTTVRFLEHFGLESPNDLPPLPEVSALETDESTSPAGDDR